jgi:peptide/nickel transport system permease protein
LAAVTLVVVLGCAVRASSRGLGSLPQACVIAAALLLLPCLVLRVLSWSVQETTSGARRWQQFAHNKLAVVGSALVVALFFVAALAPVLSPQHPTAFGDMTATRFQAPGAAFALGSDQFGRDVLTRLLHGARISLGVAFVSVVLSIFFGITVGLLAGYRGGWVDTVLMRFVDLLLAFPRIFLVLLVISLAEPSIWLVVAVLAVTGWMATARLVRGEVLSIRERDYVQAARALGIPTWRIVTRHVLPNSMAPIVVSATLMIGNVILAESVLSFLGLGVPVPTPSWGAMVDEGRGVFPGVWWLATFPGLAITVTVVAFNLLGDGLRDAWDPRTHC